jgi:large subunit ribosomal protein L30
MATEKKATKSNSSGAKIFVRQIRSTTRTKAPHKKTLEALGLGKIGKVNTLGDNPAIRGMIRHVIQWLEVKSV